MEFIFSEYPYLVPPIAVVVFLFAVWIDFFSIKKKDTAVATFAFGLLPIVGSVFYLKASFPLIVVALVSSIVYICVFLVMLARYNKDRGEGGGEMQR